MFSNVRGSRIKFEKVGGRLEKGAREFEEVGESWRELRRFEKVRESYPRLVSTELVSTGLISTGLVSTQLVSTHESNT